MVDPVESFDDMFGLEKMNVERFRTAFVTRRVSQAPTKIDLWDTMQLPNGSVLHTLNGFETLVSPNGGMPNASIPLVTNEKLPIWLKVNTLLASETSRPFGIKETFVYKPNLLGAQVLHFFSTHRQYHRIISDRTLGTMAGALTWIDYSPLNEVRVSGALANYRKFDLLFRTILDMVATIGSGKNHYILLPQSGTVFPRNILQKTFKDLSNNTLNPLLHDPSVFPLLHVMGYIFSKTHDLNVVPYKEDVRLLGKNDPSFDELKSTSLLDRLDANLLGSINFIFQKDNQAVVYNLGDITQFANDKSFFIKFYRHIMSLRLNGKDVDTGVEVDSDQFDDYVADISEKASVSDVTTDTKVVVDPVITSTPLKPAPATDGPIYATKKDLSRSQVEPVKANFEEKVRTAVTEHTAVAVQIEPKKESRRNVLVENHFKAVLAGKPLGELIQTPATQTIAPKTMDFVSSTPELSYKKSSMLAMDNAYQNHAYHHEMAKVVGSLAKHGLFIAKIDEEKTHTEMDRTTTYKLSLTDLAGKSHHVKYTVPDVDKNGLMKLGGIEYRLTRQIANVPICKTSPFRVNLSSYYNKIIVERIQSKRYSYENDVNKLILELRANGQLNAVLGAGPLPTKSVSYDYSAIGRNFTEIAFGGYTIQFGGNRAPLPERDPTLKLLPALEEKYGAYVGTNHEGGLLFWDVRNQIHLVERGTAKRSWTSFNQMLVDVIGDVAKPERTPMEWTQANIINRTIPLVYILAYRLGLKAVLDMIKLDYTFYTDRSAAVIGIDDIAVPMADGTLVFNRYPLARSLIACGLLWTDLRSFQFNDLSIPDTYIRLFQQKKMTVGVLKGLSGFFDFFVDPITETVLEKMGEPTTFHELLLRANVMLTDYHALESSSVGLHRFRLYERFNGIVYNEIYRALANHRNNPTSKKSFSINPEAVFQKIVGDATISPNEMINPVHEVKQLTSFTFTGGNGRNATSLVLKDRIYPRDGLGVISDAVPDSGKVGITAYLSASPRIDDIHGLPQAYKIGDTLEPPQILSVGSMVMPGGTTDDGKRNSYLSIQISHYVPNHGDGETLAVRTGYDEVLPHLSSDAFAVTAEDNGVVESVDDKQKVIRVRYTDKPTATIRNLKLPYLDSVMDRYRQDRTDFGYLIPDSEIGNYPIGGVFGLTKNTYGKIADRLRCESVEAIPDKEVIRKQSALIQDLNKGKYQALYYLRITPVGTKTAGVVKSYSFASLYSQNSGSYLLQTREANVKVGETFKTGDILVYNPGFFVPDPMTKQVTFKHGVIATVALVEKSSNHEDACEISQNLSSRLKMTPCHQREIVTKRDAVLLSIVKVGDHVETSDSLCIISDEYLVGSSFKLDSENLDIVEKLNRQTPPADYTGMIRKIRILYGCDREQLSDSLKDVLKVYEKEVRENFKALNNDPNAKLPEKPGWVAPGTKYLGIDFTRDTVILEFMIEETLDVWEGDKLCFANSSKSITSYVSEKQHYTESGIEVDSLFSTTSIINRIVASPFLGIAERCMSALKEQALEMYFK